MDMLGSSWAVFSSGAPFENMILVPQSTRSDQWKKSRNASEGSACLPTNEQTMGGWKSPQYQYRYTKVP